MTSGAPKQSSSTGVLPPLALGPSGRTLTTLRNRSDSYIAVIWVRLVAAVALAVVLAGCGSGLDENERRISQETFFGEWPFTATEAVVRCEQQRVSVDIDDETFAVNGAAKSGSRYPDLPYSLWLDHPEFDGLKVSIGDVINAGLALC